MKYIFLIFFICLSYSQDDLLDILNDGDVNVEYVQSAFKGTRVANAQSLEIPAPKVLQFMIQHRFGSIENGFYDLFGTDYAAIRYDFSYGFNDVLALGAGRSSFDKVYDIFLKTKLIRQSKGGKNFPISVVLFNDIGIKTNRKSEQTPALKEKFSNRLLYINQLIIGRKFNRNLSLQVLPTVIHRNLVLTPNEKHQLASLGFAGRYKITNQFSINADYFIPLDNRDSNYKNSFAVGFDYETGGHVFQLHLSNSPHMIDTDFINNTVGDFLKGDIFFGFNISRVFSLN